LNALPRSPSQAGRIRRALFQVASQGAVNTVALAWLPSGDYEQAVGLWPEVPCDRQRLFGLFDRVDVGAQIGSSGRRQA
jgi:hypothetical protein